jgi:hypothetical protein
MALNLLPLGILGAIETSGVETFSIWLPWVSAADGNAVTVKVIHEDDQFLQEEPTREFPLMHSVRAPYGDFWSGTVPIAGTLPEVEGSSWGKPGRYVYRYTIANPNAGVLDWIIDPCAREFHAPIRPSSRERQKRQKRSNGRIGRGVEPHRPTVRHKAAAHIE